MQKAKSRTAGSAIMVSCGIGIGTAIAVTLATAAIAAAFISNEYLSNEALPFVALFIEFIATFIGATLSGKTASEDARLFVCAGTAVGYAFVLVGAALLFADGISGSILTGLIACAVGCILAIMLCSKGKKRVNRTRKRKGYR